MPLHFRCRCGAVLHAPDATSGRAGECPKCGKILVVPEEALSVSVERLSPSQTSPTMRISLEAAPAAAAGEFADLVQGVEEAAGGPAAAAGGSAELVQAVEEAAGEPAAAAGEFADLAQGVGEAAAPPGTAPVLPELPLEEVAPPAPPPPPKRASPPSERRPSRAPSRPSRRAGAPSRSEVPSARGRLRSRRAAKAGRGSAVKIFLIIFILFVVLVGGFFALVLGAPHLLPEALREWLRGVGILTPAVLFP